MSNEITKDFERNLTLADKLRMKRSMSALLLDTSGSMNSDVEPGKTKIEALRDIVKSVASQKIFWFNSHFGECTKDTVPEPYGSTYLAPALNQLKTTGTRRVVVITDGDINDKTATLAAAEGMDIRVLYVGAGARPKFLDELAQQSGGFATTEDLTQTKELTSKVQLLLGSGEVKLGGAIEL